MSVTNTIIIVPGAQYPKSENPCVQSVIVKLFGLFNVIPSYSDEAEGWIQVLENENLEIIRFAWSGRASAYSVRKAAKNLASMIRKYPSVTVVSCSLGTQVALRAATGSKNIKKIISLCGVYRRTDPPFPIIDIRSSDDPFANTFHSILNLFSLTSKPTEQVLLEGIRHDEFGMDTPVRAGTFQNHRISEIIAFFLE